MKGEVMTNKKQKAKAVKLPGRVEMPNVTVRNAPDEQAVTMLDYEGSPVVTYRAADKGARPSRGAS
jgi:hypothetical protein